MAILSSCQICLHLDWRTASWIGCTQVYVEHNRRLSMHHQIRARKVVRGHLEDACSLLKTFFLRDVLEGNSEKTKIAWPKNEQPKMPHTAMPYTFSIRRRVCGVGSLHGPPKFALLGVLALA